MERCLRPLCWEAAFDSADGPIFAPLPETVSPCCRLIAEVPVPEIETARPILSLRSLPMTLVFQYGSNATRARLNGPERLDGHVHDLGPAETLDDLDIAFDVYSQKNGCAASDLVPTAGRRAWGVLYEIPEEFIRGTRADGKKTLTQIEGRRYEEQQIRVRDQDGQERDALTFVVKQSERCQKLATSAAYISWIIDGLRDHGVPEDYLSHVIEVAIATNQRAGETAAEETRLLKTL